MGPSWVRNASAMGMPWACVGHACTQCSCNGVCHGYAAGIPKMHYGPAAALRLTWHGHPTCVLRVCYGYAADVPHVCDGCATNGFTSGLWAHVPWPRRCQGICYGNAMGMPRVCYGCALGLPRPRPGRAMGMPWVCHGYATGPRYIRHGPATGGLGVCHAYAMGMPVFYGYAMGPPRACDGHAIVRNTTSLQNVCHGYAKGMRWVLYGHPIGMLCLCYGYVSSVLWACHG